MPDSIHQTQHDAALTLTAACDIHSRMRECMSRLGRNAEVAVPLLGVLLMAGCGHESPRDFEMVAPEFEASKVRFAAYGYSPVGTFANKRGDLLPFIDTDDDGKFDPNTEASGRCDQRSGQCWMDQARLRLLMTATDCPATTGTWLLGAVYGRDGRQLAATLCDDHGTCSEEHKDVFQNGGPVNAIWIPGTVEKPPARTLWLRSGRDQFHYDDIALPSPIHVVDVQTSRPGNLQISITADESIDMASLWAMRGGELQWSSTKQTFRVDGKSLEADVPQTVLDSCGGGCEVYLQFAHVWRDDNVFSLSEVKHKLL